MDSPSRNSCVNGYGMEGLGFYLLWFLIIAIIAWLVLYSLKPGFVVNSDTGNVDTGKVLLWSIVIALLGILIIWLIKRSGPSCA